MAIQERLGDVPDRLESKLPARVLLEPRGLAPLRLTWLNRNQAEHNFLKRKLATSPQLCEASAAPGLGQSWNALRPPEPPDQS
eukprot:8000707-Pyramimonas_sp.AAC.1